MHTHTQASSAARAPQQVKQSPLSTQPPTPPPGAALDVLVETLLRTNPAFRGSADARASAGLRVQDRSILLDNPGAKQAKAGARCVAARHTCLGAQACWPEAGCSGDSCKLAGMGGIGGPLKRSDGCAEAWCIRLNEVGNTPPRLHGTTYVCTARVCPSSGLQSNFVCGTCLPAFIPTSQNYRHSTPRAKYPIDATFRPYMVVDISIYLAFRHLTAADFSHHVVCQAGGTICLAFWRLTTAGTMPSSAWGQKLAGGKNIGFAVGALYLIHEGWELIPH
eukprot:1133652-Pelagomonas_calceolata.AAC.5